MSTVSPLPDRINAEDSITSASSSIEMDKKATSAHIEYPGGFKLAAIVACRFTSTFLVALDNTIIVTAILRISGRFKALDDVVWYGGAFLLTQCAFQLLFGKLCTIFSIKWVFISSLIIFEVGSALCGAAPTSAVFILGRASAGSWSCGIFSGGLVAIAHCIPLVERPICK
jgi:MFS family permease